MGDENVQVASCIQICAVRLSKRVAGEYQSAARALQGAAAVLPAGVAHAQRSHSFGHSVPIHLFGQ